MKLLGLLIENGYAISFKRKSLIDVQVHMSKSGVGQIATIKFVNFNNSIEDLLNEMKSRIDLALRTRSS